MQAAGELIRAIAELAAGVQAGEDELHGGDLGHLVHFDWNATSIVLNGDGAVGVNGDPDVFAVAGEVLVDGIVHDFENAVVQAALIGIADVHAGAQANGLKALQLLDLIRTIGLISGHIGEKGVIFGLVLRHKGHCFGS